MHNDAQRRTIQEFISFRFMVTPVFIQIIWLIGSALIVLGGLVSLFVSGDAMTIIGGLLIGLPVSLLLWRVYCELVILLFRIHDAIVETKGGSGASTSASAAGE
ncbi:MAG: DUF4282 domain-containing protein [Phycisphaerales bacterium]